MLLRFPLRRKDFCDMHQKMARCTAPSQLVADIPKRSEHLLSHNSLHKWRQQPSFISPLLLLLFLYWLLIDWYSRSTKCCPFPLIWKCASSASLLPIQPSGACSVEKHAFSMLCSCSCNFPGFFTTVLSNVLSAGTSWCGCPLKIRINVLSPQDAIHRNGERRKFSMHLTFKEQGIAFTKRQI